MVPVLIAAEAQTLLALAQEKERTATEKMSEIGSRCTALEASNSQLRQEKAHLAAQQASDHRRIDMLEERKARYIVTVQKVINFHVIIGCIGKTVWWWTCCGDGVCECACVDTQVQSFGLLARPRQ